MRHGTYRDTMITHGAALRELHRRELREFIASANTRPAPTVFDELAVHQRGKAAPAQRRIKGGTRYDGALVTLSQPGLTRNQYHSAAGEFASRTFEL